MNYSWIVTTMDVIPATDANINVVIRAYYTFSAHDSGHSASINSVQEFVLDPNKDFIPYENLTQSDVVEWIKVAMGMDQLKALENELAVAINDQKNPPSVTLPPPWAS